MLEDGCENCNNIRKRPSTVRYNSSKQAKRYGRGAQLGKQQSKGVSRARSSRDSRPRGSRRQQSKRQAEQETTRSSNEKISRKDIETITTVRQHNKTAVTAQSPKEQRTKSHRWRRHRCADLVTFNPKGTDPITPLTQTEQTLEVTRGQRGERREI